MTSPSRAQSRVSTNASSLNEHFIKPCPPSEFQWQLSFSERWRVTNDPRLQKLYYDAEIFRGTLCESIFHRIATFAPARNDYMMDTTTFIEMLNVIGVTGAQQQARLRERFDPKQTERYNAIMITRRIEAILTTLGEKRDRILRHCYDQFDRSIGSATMSRKLIEAFPLSETMLASPEQKKNKKKSPRRASDKSSPAKGAPDSSLLGTAAPPPSERAIPPPLAQNVRVMNSGATYAMLRGLKDILHYQQLQVAKRAEYVLQDEIPFEFFCMWLTDARYSSWLCSFLGVILDCIAFTYADGMLPYISVKYERSVEPIPKSRHMHDGDAYLLRWIEEKSNGIVPPLAFGNAKQKKQGKKQSNKKQK